MRDMMGDILEGLRTIREEEKEEISCPLKDVIEYAEKMAKLLKLEQSNEAKEQRDGFCNIVRKCIEKAYNIDKINSSKVDKLLTKDLTIWKAEAIDIPKRYSIAWKMSIVDYCKEKYGII